ncbi:DUF572-domain-containing protein [Setomelanomma holmii]|uniref:DUF572-domain-containing protein n=1 Tax=Setomelanomma holmii TaxID=210430 RepID=A0A9P4LHQ9_9PLEO|nr:DUF572-domain-containing protein [Setomelanomma holmii]
MQGYNMGRYYPPDASNPPTFNTSHPLGKRASKSSQGILTVRFELPFAVWCEHCTPQAIVGQGVRFNAEKKNVGKYYSTPIWSFRMKHSACGGWWEIRTDPKNAEYVVVEGAKKRDYGPEEKGAEADGDLKFLTEEDKERRRNDAFANLEGRIEDKGTDKKNRERVEELYEKSEVWKDPYEVNARLRGGFRVGRKVREQEDRRKERIQEQFGLVIDIADETEADRMHASIVEFGSIEADDRTTGRSNWKPLFAENIPSGHASGQKKLKGEIKTEKSRQNLQHSLVHNTKAAIDPFLSRDSNSKPKPTFGALKRKRDRQNEPEMATSTAGVNKKAALSEVLVAYDSD